MFHQEEKRGAVNPRKSRAHEGPVSGSFPPNRPRNLYEGGSRAGQLSPLARVKAGLSDPSWSVDGRHPRRAPEGPPPRIPTRPTSTPPSATNACGRRSAPVNAPPEKDRHDPCNSFYPPRKQNKRVNGAPPRRF